MKKQKMNYDRMKINEIVTNSLEERGGANFRSLKRSDLYNTFRIIDDNAFAGDVLNRLSEISATIEYKLGKRTDNTVIFCDWINNKNIKIILDLSPNVLAKIAKQEGYNRVDCLIDLYEHVLVYIMIMAYEPVSINNHNISIFRFYDCLFRNFFGKEPNQRIISEMWLTNFTQPHKIGIFTYWNNSCYIDSLLTILFLSTKGSYYRNKLLYSDIDSTSKESYKAICQTDSYIQSDKQLNDMIKNLQMFMNRDFDMISKNTRKIKCENIRGLISECLSDMVSKKGRNNYKFYNASALYNALSEFFPAIKIRGMTQMYRNKYTNNLIIQKDIQPVALFQMWDYMDPYPEQKEFVHINWNKLSTKDESDNPDNPHVLVFQNGGIPLIMNLDSPETEDNKDYIEETGNKILKHPTRYFGEYILNNNYRLFGAMILEGTVPGQDDTGVHYTAYLRRRIYSSDKSDDSSWWYYNDSGPILKELTELPHKKVFREKLGRKPTMYFYEKI